MSRRMACPQCKSVLSLPPGSAGRRVRCGRCKNPFVVPSLGTATEEDVAAWLNEEDEVEPSPAGQPKPEPSQAATATATESKPPPEKPVATGLIRVVKIGQDGVLFEFPVRRLRETAFRCAMPRKCLGCGAQAHLQAHVIRYLSQGVDMSVKAEHDAGKLMVLEQELRGLNDEEMLNRLPKVPNATPPADLPMPYWLCDMCSGSGIIVGRMEINPGTGRGRCQLRIQPLRRAEEFLASAGGKGSEGHQKLVEVIEATTESPWERLSMVVQDRIEQWYTPDDNESFIAYIPDRDHTRTEDGVAGLLVSTRRLIHHTRTRHRELDIHTQVEFQLAMAGPRGHLQIAAGGPWVKHFTIDRDGVRRLRGALTHAKCPARWR